jgi:hypothetical protein
VLRGVEPALAEASCLRHRASCRDGRLPVRRPAIPGMARLDHHPADSGWVHGPERRTRAFSSISAGPKHAQRDSIEVVVQCREPRRCTGGGQQIGRGRGAPGEPLQQAAPAQTPSGVQALKRLVRQRVVTATRRRGAPAISSETEALALVGVRSEPAGRRTCQGAPTRTPSVWRRTSGTGRDFV